MLNSRHKEAILSPSLSRITKRIRSSITEHFLHGMFYILPPQRQNVLPMSPERSVTYVSGRSSKVYIQCSRGVSVSQSTRVGGQLDGADFPGRRCLPIS